MFPFIILVFIMKKRSIFCEVGTGIVNLGLMQHIPACVLRRRSVFNEISLINGRRLTALFRVCSGDCAVGVVTRLLNRRAGVRFPAGTHSCSFFKLTTPALGPTHPSGGEVHFPWGISRPADYPPPSSAEVKERVELYVSSFYGPELLHKVDISLRCGSVL
jgi:hypothetical protein